MRYEMWHRCDLEHGHNYIKQIRQGTPKKGEEWVYPCFENYYEAIASCNDDWFDFLNELHYYRTASNIHEEDFWNKEISTPPTTYDSPEHADQRTYTY